MNVGAKISLDVENRELVRRLSEEMDFIEVFFKRKMLPLEEVKSLDTRWVMHGPHVSHGVNFSNLTDEGKRMFQDSILLASNLGARYVITHPGSYKKGDDRERMRESMVENILSMKDFAGENSVELILENVMYEDVYALNRGMTETSDFYFAYSPEEVKELTKRLKVDFLMDFSHASITAKEMGLDQKEFIKEFASLKPAMFHICDNKSDKPFDMHLPLGRGDYDIGFFASLIGDRDVTLEVSSGHIEGKMPTFDDFAQSIDHLRSLGVRFN